MPKPTIAQVAWNAQDATYQVYEKEDAGTGLSLMDFEGQLWQFWLVERSSFAFQSRGGDRFTARKETRARGSTYRVAYRKVGGKLTHTYIGRPEDVTLVRLEQAASFLAGQASQDMNSLSALEQQARQEPPITMGWQDQYLATKFFLPAAPHTLIARPRLFSLLEEGRGRPLTLISAPAGFGKTTLLSTWVQAQLAGNPLVAWVSLDEADNDPVRFWSYVLTALDRVQPGEYSEFAAYLQSGDQPPLHSIMTACLNRLSEHPESMIHMVLGEAVAATARIRAALIILESLGNSASTALIIQSHNLAAYYLSSRGLLQEAWVALGQAEQLGSIPGGLPYSTMAAVYAYQADLLREWNRLDEALERARISVQLTNYTGGSMAFTALAFLFKVLLARGEFEEASTVLQHVEHLMDHLQNPYQDALYVLVDQVRFWLERGEIERAVQWAERLERQDPLQSPLAQGRVDVSLTHVKLAQRKPDEALTLLKPRLEAAAQQERWGNVLEMQLLAALAHQMRGEEQEALTLLAEAVRLAQPEGHIRSFVDEGPPMAVLLSSLRAGKHGKGKAGNDAMIWWSR